jgi:CDP-4-dehydro-6-deoxyglucose reductase, E3
VLSEAGPEWRGRRGWVHEVALKEIPDLESIEVYAAGPPAMIAAVQREYDSRGSAKTRLYYDSFDPASDTLAHQRMSAAAKS